MKLPIKKRINTVAKGNRHKNRTIKWFESLGYKCEGCECRTRYSTRDLFASDVVARNKTEIIFAQVKANKGGISAGVRELSKDDLWPPMVKRMVVHWGCLTDKGPLIVVVE